MIHRPASLFPLVLATLLVAACSSQEPPSPVTAAPVNTAAFDLTATRKVIEAQSDRFTKAHVAGDIATIDAMYYVMTYGADKVTERGKYLNVWKQEDGAWKIHANIWNTNSVPAPVK
jgi:ketosteroid isomerase-like protein